MVKIKVKEKYTPYELVHLKAYLQKKVNQFSSNYYSGSNAPYVAGKVSINKGKAALWNMTQAQQLLFSVKFKLGLWNALTPINRLMYKREMLEKKLTVLQNATKGKGNKDFINEYNRLRNRKKELSYEEVIKDHVTKIKKIGKKQTWWNNLISLRVKNRGGILDGFEMTRETINTPKKSDK